MPPLSIMLWLPAACGLLGAMLSLLGRRAGVVEAAEIPAGKRASRAARCRVSAPPARSR